MVSLCFGDDSSFSSSEHNNNNNNCDIDAFIVLILGKIGKKGFELLMNDSRFAKIPMILETPGFNDYAKQIDLLNSLVKV